MTEIDDNTNEYELAPPVDRLGQFTELFGEKAAEPLQDRRHPDRRPRRRDLDAYVPLFRTRPQRHLLLPHR